MGILSSALRILTSVFENLKVQISGWIMSPERARHHKSKIPESADSKPLRDGLEEIKRWLSWGKIVLLAERCGIDLDITGDGLRQFYDTTTGNLAPHRRDALATFLFDVPVGRLLRNPSFQGAPGIDDLLRTLTSGRNSHSPSTSIQGLYFAYHGSHLKEKHFVVSAIQIVNVGQTITRRRHLFQ
jgi:hypothetical protein